MTENACLLPTEILDFESPEVQEFVEKIDPEDDSPRGIVQAAHQLINNRVGPVYTIDEFQPVSITLRKGRGSCSQRMAVLEAISRSQGIATRVRALWISGRFWNRRFPFAKFFIPRRILISWPQFYLENTRTENTSTEHNWIDFDEVFKPATEFSIFGDGGFTNDDETMFEAVAKRPVDLLGKSRKCAGGCVPGVDLSSFLIADVGFYNTRDELYKELGSFQLSLRGRIFEAIYGGRKSR